MSYEDEYTPIRCFFGDYNRVLNSLTNGEVGSIASKPILSFKEVSKVVVCFDLRIGKILSFHDTEIHLKSGEIILGSTIEDEESFRQITNKKSFSPKVKVNGFSLINVTNKEEDIKKLKEIEKLLLEEKFLQAKGFTQASSCFIWEER